MNLYQKWIDAKAAEGAAMAKRREVEDMLTDTLNIDASSDGSQTIKEGGYKATITTRINRTVDSVKVQEVAAENGIPFSVLQRVFRWKADIDKREFRNEKDEVKALLSQAITAKPGRPSYKIEKIEEDQQ